MYLTLFTITNGVAEEKEENSYPTHAHLLSAQFGIPQGRAILGSHITCLATPARAKEVMAAS